MIYEYKNRFVVQFDNGKRASYSKKRYGSHAGKITKLSDSLNRKIWNYFEVKGNTIILFYYSQKEKREYEILIDKEDYEKIQNFYWTLNCNGYPYSRTGGKVHYIYNIIMNFSHDEKRVVDHIDRNPLNNIKKNLRIVSYSLNNLNRESKGVKIENQTYYARLTYHGKETLVKCDSYEEALLKRQEMLAKKFND